jgi:three-Cys-motif partner protein
LLSGTSILSSQAIFVEKTPSAFETLKQALQEHCGQVKAVALKGVFEDNIAQVLREAGTAFAFFFIDPTGWSVSLDRLRPILRRIRCEVMINFMYDFVNRFLGFESARNEASLDRYFGTGNWRAVRDAPDREAALVNLYVAQVRKAGDFDYATFTRVLKPLQDRAYFHLVYATRNPKGISEFREVERRTAQVQDDVRDRARRRDRVSRTGQTELDLGSGGLSPSFRDDRQRQLEKAEARIAELLQSGPLPFEVLQPRVLELPLVWVSDVSKILAQGHREGRYVIEGLRPRERTPRPGCRIALLNP